MADLSPRQSEAWRYLEDRTTTEILYGGGAGGGKSWLGALWLLTNALRYPGSRWLMGRAVAKTLKETTLNSFFDVCSAHGLRSGEHYVYNAQTGQIAIGASTILLKDLFAYPSDPNFDDLGSLEITGAFIDEANQITEKAKAIVSSRIRYRLDEFGLVPKLLMTCNPAKNWVYREFYAPWRSRELPSYRAFVPALVTDNPTFKPTVLADGTTDPHPYVKSLMRMAGADRERLLNGNWAYDYDPARLIPTDAINDMFSNHHVPFGDPAMVVDVAGPGKDKTVVSVWRGLRLVHYYVEDKSTGPALVASIESLAKSEGVWRSRIVVDADGIGGMGVADYLAGCFRFNANATPALVEGQKQAFKSYKAQCGYLLADHVNARDIHIEDDRYREQISEELAWLRTWKVDKDGPKAIMPKDEIKNGLGRSPDFGDNLLMRMALELTPDFANFERSIDNVFHRERREGFKRWVEEQFPSLHP